MKITKRIVLAVSILAIASASLVIYSAGSELPVFQRILNAEEAASNTTDITGLHSMDIVMYIDGNGISADQFLSKYEQNRTLGISDPYKSTVNSFKKLICEEKYAIENNIYPSEEDIRSYTAYQINCVANDPNGENVIKKICEAKGITESEYWNEIKPEEDRLYLIHMAVENDLKKKNISTNLDTSEVSVKIIDKQYSETEIDQTISRLKATDSKY